MFQNLQDGLPKGVREIIQGRKSAIICDRTMDWSLTSETTEGWIPFDPAVFMFDLDEFWLQKRTGIEYVGHSMGSNMELKKGEWICPMSKRQGLRYKYWKKSPLAWEVKAYTVFKH